MQTSDKFKIGCHLSSSKGFLAMGKEALSINANTFQFFTRNPRGSAAKALDLNDVNAYVKFAEENEFATILAHSPYTLNPCAIDEGLRKFAQDTMADDLMRLQHVPDSMYNFHPGSHVKQGSESCVCLIADMLNAIIKEEQNTLVLLETMSGKGSEVGRTFEELRAIIDMVELESHIGVCLDICHVHDSGYDIVNNLDGVLEHFDEIIGLKRLRAIHLNDSSNPLGSHKDRHARIGEGTIGIDTFARIINHPSLRDLPFYLETPNDTEGHGKEVELLRSLRNP